MGQTFTKVSSFFSSGSEKTSEVVHEKDVTFLHHSECASFTLAAYRLATPRSPLCRTKRPLSPCTDFAREPQKKQLKPDFQYLNLPFLNNYFTVNFIQKSKVMFIMKGLPGSGKSFIVEVIKEVYKDTFVCSAGYYFIQNGLYQFDREKLKDAHASCQDQATNAAKQNIHVIVIDNTNVKHWEMKFYLNLARNHLYIPVVVEPQTPWAMNPHVLAVKNVHNIPKEILIDKIESYQPVQPIYYGWFLNEVDSAEIRSMGLSWFQQALEIEDFTVEFLQAFHANSKEDLLCLFSQGYSTDGGRMLHATSKFTARGKRTGAKEYMESELVKKSMGKGFNLCIVGFVITTRTIGARLELTEEQLELWPNNDNEGPPVTVANSDVMREHHPNNINCEQNKEQIRFSQHKNTSVCVPTVTEIEISQNKNRFHPISGKGSRAHLTLACAPGIKPVTTGFDLILAVRCEQRALEFENQKVSTYNIDRAVLRNYGEGIWVVYPKYKILVSSLFSAFY